MKSKFSKGCRGYANEEDKKLQLIIFQLESMANSLKDENDAKQMIINKQNHELNILRKKIYEYETKCKLIVGNQMNKMNKEAKTETKRKIKK